MNEKRIEEIADKYFPPATHNAANVLCRAAMREFEAAQNAAGQMPDGASVGCGKQVPYAPSAAAPQIPSPYTEHTINAAGQASAMSYGTPAKSSLTPAAPTERRSAGKEKRNG